LQRFGVWWSWFRTVDGTVGPSAMRPTPWVRIYQSPAVLTLDEANAVPPKFVSITLLSECRMQILGKGPRGATNRIFAATNITLPIGSWTGIFSGKFAGGCSQ